MALNTNNPRDRCGCDRMVVGFTTVCAISAYHHESGNLWQVGSFIRILVSSTSKTYRQDITKILLKVALNTITLPQ